MEYLVGFIVAAGAMLVLARMVSNNARSWKKLSTPQLSQARVHSLIGPYSVEEALSRFAYKETQSTKFEEVRFTRVVFVDNEAYWISNNSLVCAPAKGGEIDHSMVKPVDMMALDKVELDRMIFIVEQLNGGKG